MQHLKYIQILPGITIKILSCSDRGITINNIAYFTDTWRNAPGVLPRVVDAAGSGLANILGE